MSDYVIRPLTVDEVQKAVDWAGREGWNPGYHDARCFHGTDPRGFLGGFLDGEMIASISVVKRLTSDKPIWCTCSAVKSVVVEWLNCIL